jgi:Ca-activated chloride channel homolog
MTEPTLTLAAGLDRALAWRGGKSVRYLVADLSAQGTVPANDAPPLNLALAIDASGSMAGEKIVAARATAAAVVAALGPRDRLSLVAFASKAVLLLDACPMDVAGRSRARAAIARLEATSNTALFDGWLLAAERVATAMDSGEPATHRVMLLSDGQANVGITDHKELAGHAGELLARGIITSAVGIGDGYDEQLLGAMAVAGGGRLHDAGAAREIGEVVLGEIGEGRQTLLERATLRLTVPANIRAEVVGGWAHTVLPGSIDVLMGNLLPDTPRRIVFRLHCPNGEAGTTMLLAVAAHGSVPGGAGFVEAAPREVELRLAAGRDNHAQPRDLARSLAVIEAWQAEVLRRAVEMNRGDQRRAGRSYLARQLEWLQRYARGVPGAEPLLAELVLVERNASEEWDERTRKGMFEEANMRSFGQLNMKTADRMDIAARFASPRLPPQARSR